MRQITVETELGQQLTELSGQVVLCDAAGRALGFFSPLNEGDRLEDLQLEPPSSIAEIETLRKQPMGKPLSEILDRLGRS